MNKNWMTRMMLVAGFLGMLLAFLSGGVAAQETGSGWSPQVLDAGPASQPVLVVDSQDRVHALWVRLFSLEDGTADAIKVARRDPMGDWTTPVDVLMPPRGVNLQFLVAVIDQSDTIHLVAMLSDGLYYSQAPADQAGTARAWSPFTIISRQHAGPSDIALDPDGTTLHVVYPEIYAPPGVVYYISSRDGGATWSDPAAVSVPSQANAEPINTQIAIAPSGRIHVVWSETVELFPPSGVFYAYSDDQGRSWSMQQMLAGRGYNWISIGLEPDDSRVHLIWTGTAEVVGKYHARSADGGLTWSDPERVFYGWAGYLGFSKFALDSAGRLHLVTALGRTAAGTEWAGDPWYSPGDIFLSLWEGSRWGEPDHVSEAITDPQLEQSQPSIVFSEGNLLHLAWSGTYHPEDTEHVVWYASQRVDAPRVAPRKTVAVTAENGSTPLPAATPVTAQSNPTATSTQPEGTSPSLPPPDVARSDWTGSAVLAGVVPVLVIVLVVIVLAAGGKKR